ncbi:MAG: ATP-binding cassette domain-containing protein [Myxococcales bacterium]|nr:ATP-binding cassette domain-containing protein [Myxococcales bacterium]
MIALEAVTKRYGDRTVVDGVSLEVRRGEVLALLGGSGSGKTTTLKMINRLIEPTAGRITLGGRDTASMLSHELRRRIGYVLQEVGLFPHMTVEENVGITPRLLGWPAEKIRARVGELLELVELDAATFRGRSAHELSGGQRQRVGIARALAADPEVMLLDEPFGALDPITRRRLQRLFVSIRETRELTAVVVTHDVAEAMLLGTRLAVMHRGVLVQEGKSEEVASAPANDYVRALLSGDDEPPVEATA